MLVVFLDIFLSLSLENTDDRYLNFFEIPIKKYIFTVDFFRLLGEKYLMNLHGMT